MCAVRLYATLPTVSSGGEHMNKRNAVTFLLEAALQEKTDYKVRVEWGGRNMKKGYIIERLPDAEIFIRLDPNYFDEEIEIIEVWKKLSSWVETYEFNPFTSIGARVFLPPSLEEDMNERYRQTSLREYFHEEET